VNEHKEKNDMDKKSKRRKREEKKEEDRPKLSVHLR